MIVWEEKRNLWDTSFPTRIILKSKLFLTNKMSDYGVHNFAPARSRTFRFGGAEPRHVERIPIQRRAPVTQLPPKSKPTHRT